MQLFTVGQNSSAACGGLHLFPDPKVPAARTQNLTDNTLPGLSVNGDRGLGQEVIDGARGYGQWLAAVDEVM